ncbi:GGDEF domain-containing protein [Jiella avicenniae]|uniref:diguanylate cyclase n=1 Tax=Jiella avicenniae TaxID=2907202 RepID=A0A9X1NWI1_9HYPH|nr:GGDEF domain-containing protein [Jiella avicenniae]MCE7027045.1 GGDEF domain-containing protein [Jiella avicenniae]
MRVARAELSVAFVICALLAASALIYASYRLTGSFQGEVIDEALRQQYARMTFLALGFVGAAGFGSLFVVLPLLRHHDREQGKLRSLTVLLKERSKKLEAAALTDPLTGTHNRRFFDEALSQYVQEFKRIDRPLGLILIDLDHFKAINDSHGHDTGDEVLRAVAFCLFEVTRFHDVVARIGGEEFAIIAPNLAFDELRRFAEKLRHEISRVALAVGEQRLGVTASIGLALAGPEDGPGSLTKRADVNLYQAKQGGRNRVVI